ncbi:MAG: iduronate sulfatase [Verrucomicrobia bacterium]|nr:iduronate sulfatase [Verrucomicrobiota bacterium]
MKPFLPILISSFFLLNSSFSAQRPNVLLIFTDDHGWADLGAQGVDKDIRTPHTDQLARDGVRFTRGYVTGPQCVPSRAGVLTGIHQNRFGVDDNHKGPLPLSIPTLATRLKAFGYISGMSGKWHLDVAGPKGGAQTTRMSPAHLPHAHGFDEYWCGSMRQYHASHALDGTPFSDAPRLVTDNRFRITVQTEAALGFLERRAKTPDQPWFLYLPWFAPHVPLESPEPWFSKTPAHLPKERRQALAMIAAMDDGLGRIRAKLKAMGQEQRTLIFYISDNGAPLKPGAWDGSLNAPLIGEKGMLTDGGVRVPFVAAWPGALPAGKVYEHPVSSLDVAATAVALAGLDSSHLAPRDGSAGDLTRSVRSTLDGVNLMPFLTGEKKGVPHDALYWRWRSQAAVLAFPWKLIHLGADESYLFNVTEPQGETINLIKDHPDIAARLDAKLKAWMAGLHRPGPQESLNPQDKYFFDTHVVKIEVPSRSKPASEGTIQGWLCRNGTFAVNNGALVITPEAKGRPFITNAALDLPGPLTAVVRLRAKRAGQGSFAWRTKEQKDFMSGNTVSFQWTASSEFQEITTQLPAQGRVIHLRIHPSKDNSVEIQSIELRGQRRKTQSWQFNGTRKDGP